ncbi:metal-dependent hydrolase [Candidatus Woesearchaeota archaeon]|nr:metal-dependent hydrolase [Candidatus Woesearchaeota archaeon]
MNIIITSASLFILDSLGMIDFWSLNILHLVIAVYVFSNLPDIDNANSKMSYTFFLFYIIFFMLGLSDHKSNPLLSIGKMMLAMLMGWYHVMVMEKGRKHRKFPHTFTFGILASLILWLYTSLPIALTGFFCFFLHLLFDRHVSAALRNDMHMWLRK